MVENRTLLDPLDADIFHTEIGPISLIVLSMAVYYAIAMTNHKDHSNSSNHRLSFMMALFTTVISVIAHM